MLRGCDHQSVGSVSALLEKIQTTAAEASQAHKDGDSVKLDIVNSARTIQQLHDKTKSTEVQFHAQIKRHLQDVESLTHQKNETFLEILATKLGNNIAGSNESQHQMSPVLDSPATLQGKQSSSSRLPDNQDEEPSLFVPEATPEASTRSNVPSML